MSPHPSIRRKVECGNCGDTFTKARSKAVRSDNHFCDRDCFNEWHTGENNHSFDSARTTVSCDNCGESITRYRSQLSEKNFCDKECYTSWQRDSDYDCSFYRTKGWERKREEIRERDNHRCRWCGESGELHVHHIRPISAGGDKLSEKNLVSLCQECHTIAHKALTV